MKSVSSGAGPRDIEVGIQDFVAVGSLNSAVLEVGFQAGSVSIYNH